MKNCIKRSKIAKNVLYGKLKDFRGKWIEKNNKEFFVTYHPATGLRFPTIRKILKEDFKKLKKGLETIKMLKK